MLSFDTVHAITENLVAATATAADTAPGVDHLSQPPNLLLLDEHPTALASPLRLLRTLHLPLPADTAADRPLQHLLHDTALALSRLGTRHPIMHAVNNADAGVAATRTRRRLLAWAVRYIDIDMSTGAPHLARRVDAVDVDGRIYQVSLLQAETRPVVHIDEHPHPHDSPPTASGLAALAIATGALVGTRARA